MSHQPQSAVSRLRRVDAIASESFGDIEVAFDPASGIVRRLNGTASEIWRLLVDPHDATEIVAEIRLRSTGMAPNLEADVLRFVDELMMWGLVARVDS